MERELHGVLAPITTPFDKTGDIDFRALTDNIVKYSATELSGLLVLGSTGEASHLEVSERLAAVRCARTAWPGEKALLVGVSFPSLRSCRSFVEKLSEFRIDGLLVSVPSYYKTRMDDRTLEKFFSQVADHSPFPVLLYNIPRFTGIELSVELVETLSDHPNIAGMKDSSGNLIYLQKVLAVTERSDFQVLSGSAETFGLAVSLGVEAGILAVACAAPEIAQAVYETQVARSPEWREVQARLFRVSSLVVGKLSVPGVKYAMDVQGYAGGACREPLGPLSEDEKAAVREVLG